MLMGMKYHIHKHIRKESIRSVISMSRTGKHAKPLTNVEETYMDLMIKIRQGEEFLNQEKTRALPDIELDPIDDLELIPPFSKITDIETKEYPQEDRIEDPCMKTDKQQTEQVRIYTTYTDIESSVKLTAGEWLEARKKGIFIVFMIISVLISQLVSVWAKPSLLTLFCKTYVYVGTLCLIVIALRWIFSGGLHRYLNEEA